MSIRSYQNDFDREKVSQKVQVKQKHIYDHRLYIAFDIRVVIFDAVVLGDIDIPKIQFRLFDQSIRFAQKMDVLKL